MWQSGNIDQAPWGHDQADLTRTEAHRPGRPRPQERRPLRVGRIQPRHPRRPYPLCDRHDRQAARRPPGPPRHLLPERPARRRPADRRAHRLRPPGHAGLLLGPDEPATARLRREGPRPDRGGVEYPDRLQPHQRRFPDHLAAAIEGAGRAPTAHRHARVAAAAVLPYPERRWPSLRRKPWREPGPAVSWWKPWREPEPAPSPGAAACPPSRRRAASRRAPGAAR